MARRAMRLLAALLAGGGGLLVETAAVRRQALWIGSDAEAGAAVVAVFLLGLGLGGVVAARSSRLRARPRAGAAALYGSVALLALLADTALSAVGPIGGTAGAALAVLCLPGAPAIAMGAAFPLLFAGLPEAGGGRVRALIALNLLGSVVAAWLGPNVLVPTLGIGTTLVVGAALYVGAAASVLACDLGGAAVAPTRRPAALGEHGRAAFVAGVVVVGGQVLLLRRLPFFLEGFQPTLSGVLAACLLGLTLGAAVGPPLFRRLAGPRAAGTAAVAGALILSLSLHEHFAPSLSRLAVGSDAGMHLRVALTAGVAAVPAMFALGAVVPLAITAFPALERDAAAGLLFLRQGLGGLVGAIGVGQLMPWLFPESFFVATPLALALVAVVLAADSATLAARAGTVGAATLVAVTGLSGPGSLFDPAPPVRGSRWDRPLAYRPIAHRTDSVTTASVVYDRSVHSMVLFTDEFRAAYTGPGTSYMKVLGHLPFLMRENLRDVAVVALGTGTTADAVSAWPDAERLHVVEISRAVLALAGHFGGDGPVPTHELPPFLADARTEVHVADGRRWLVERPAESLDVVTMEPLLPYAPGTAALYSAEFYAIARERLRSAGLFVQWVPTHAMPRETFDTLLATFVDGFAHTSAWLVEQSTLLVGSSEPHLAGVDSLVARLNAAPHAAAVTLHEAGLANEQDLLAAFVASGPAIADVLADAVRLTDDRPIVERIGYWSGEERLSFLPRNLDRLADFAAADRSPALGSAGDAARRVRRLRGLAERALTRLDPTGARAAAAVAAAASLRADAPRSVLLHGEETLALRALVEAEAFRRGMAGAAPFARRHLERDPGAAFLRLVAAADAPVEEARELVRQALALDPTLSLPEGLRPLGPAPDERAAPLDDLATLPSGEALTELASRADVRGLAVRAAFGTRVGVATVGVAAHRRLTSPEAAAFARVADPETLDDYAEACAARGGDVVAEVAPVWRHDLPIPRALVAAASSEDPEVRAAVAATLGGRRGRAEREVLAHLLVDPDREVRLAASAALVLTAGDAVAYDPDGPVAEREVAARAVRALHNRRP